MSSERERALRIYEEIFEGYNYDTFNNQQVNDMYQDYLKLLEEEVNENKLLCEHANKFEKEKNESQNDDNLLYEHAETFERELNNRKRADHENDTYYQEGGYNEFFDIEVLSKRINNNFKIKEIGFKIRFKNVPANINTLDEILRHSIRSLLDYVRDIYPNDT